MGCTTQEIADALGLTQGTVLTRLHRARNQLRELLGLTGAALGEGVA
jgi:DNA-directed RNA polymerase specialized sigma24 family protein